MSTNTPTVGEVDFPEGAGLGDGLGDGLNDPPGATALGDAAPGDAFRAEAVGAVAPEVELQAATKRITARMENALMVESTAAAPRRLRRRRWPLTIVRP
jgi:hypothetical protein